MAGGSYPRMAANGMGAPQNYPGAAMASPPSYTGQVMPSYGQVQQQQQMHQAPQQHASVQQHQQQMQLPVPHNAGAQSGGSLRPLGSVGMAPQSAPLMSPKGESPSAYASNSPAQAAYAGQPVPTTNIVAAQPMPRAVQQAIPAGGREQALERRVQELESLLVQKDSMIQDMEIQLANIKKNPGSKRGSQKMGGSCTGSKTSVRAGSKPTQPYTARDPDDPIDVRLQEFYNSSGATTQFQRINRGFYRFGGSVVELNIINHKLMARTEDGWNRGKFGPIDKFLMHYEGHD